MYGLNAFALVFFIGINLLAYRLCKRPPQARKSALRALCALLLAFNALRYGFLYPFVRGEVKIPVEFSTVAYFAVPILLLRAKADARSWAAYSGLMAGFFYCVALITVGGPVYSAKPPYDTYISLFCHGTLYFCGLITIGTERCAARDTPRLMAGVVYIAARALALRPLVDDPPRYFIYILLDGLCVKRFCPPSLWGVALPLYYLAVAAAVCFSIRYFFVLCQRQYGRFAAPCAL